MLIGICSKRSLHSHLRNVPAVRWKKALVGHRPTDTSTSKIWGSIEGRNIRKVIASCSDINTLHKIGLDWIHDMSTVGCVIQRFGEIPNTEYEDTEIVKIILSLVHCADVSETLFTQTMSTLRRLKKTTESRILWNKTSPLIRSTEVSSTASMWSAYVDGDIEWATSIFNECMSNSSQSAHLMQPFIMAQARAGNWEFALLKMTKTVISSLLKIATFQQNPVGWEVLRMARIKELPFSTADLTSMLQFLIKVGTDGELEWGYHRTVKYATLFDSRLLIFLAGIAALRYTQSLSSTWLSCYDQHMAAIHNLPSNISCVTWETRMSDRLQQLFKCIRYRGNECDSDNREGEYTISILLGRPLPSDNAITDVMARLSALKLR